MDWTDDRLPWPVIDGRSCLVATHWFPDVDGLACASAWLHLARAMQPNARIALFTPTPVPERLAWLVEGVTLEDGRSLATFEACLVLDCTPESKRTRLPEGWIRERATVGRIWCVDHHGSEGLAGSPALACAFLDQGLHHPLFFASIWSDTRRLAYHQGDAVRYLAKLFSGGLDDAEASRQQQLLEPRRPEVLFRDIVERTEVVLSCEVDSVGTALVVASSRPWRHADTIHEVRELLLHYADFLVVIDRERDRVSMWSLSGQDLGLGEVASAMLGGGGHPHMAGGSLGGASPSEMGERILAAVARHARKRST